MNNADLDAFARMLDGDLPEGEATAEARSLGALAQALSASAAVPQMQSKADLRAVLVEAAREQAAAPSLLGRLRTSADAATARWRYSMRLAAATGASALALSSGGVALAASRATPSDPLFYDVKLIAQDIRVAFVGDPIERGELLLAYADQRLAEAEAAAAAGDMDAARRALNEADESGRSGAGYIIQASQDQGEPGLLKVLDEFTEEQRKRIAALLPQLSGEAAAVAEDVMVSLRRINQRLAVLSGPCGQCGIDAAQGRDADAAADPNFDFSKIPPASEPFAPCPCVTDGTTPGAASGGGKASGAAGEGKQSAGSGSGPSDEPSGAGGNEPGDGNGGNGGSGGNGGEEPGEEPGEDPGVTDPVDEVIEPLPDDVEDPVKDTLDDADDVIDDVIKSIPTPTELPDLPGLP